MENNKAPLSAAELDKTAFEAWARDHLGQGYPLTMDEHTYEHPVTRWAFKAWQAATAELRVDLQAAQAHFLAQQDQAEHYRAKCAALAAPVAAQANTTEPSAGALTELMTYPSPHGTLVRLADVKCWVMKTTRTPATSAGEADTTASVSPAPRAQQKWQVWDEVAPEIFPFTSGSRIGVAATLADAEKIVAAHNETVSAAELALQYGHQLPYGLIEALKEASQILSGEREKREPLADELWGFALMLAAGDK